MTLQDHAQAMGIALSSEQIAAFQQFSAELLDWNQRMNLTAITDPVQVESKHFLDSLSCLLALPHLNEQSLSHWLAQPMRAVDIGSGAGLPGLALKIVWPALRLTLLDATAKKCRFMQHVVDTLKLSDVAVVQGRAEDFGRHAGRMAFDLALARAVGRMPVLLEYGLPMLCMGGFFIVQKGRDAQEEIDSGRLALRMLGGSLRFARQVTVPGLEAERSLIVVAKTAQTPGVFPRRAGVPEREPIGG